MRMILLCVRYFLNLKRFFFDVCPGEESKPADEDEKHDRDIYHGVSLISGERNEGCFVA